MLEIKKNISKISLGIMKKHNIYINNINYKIDILI